MKAAIICCLALLPATTFACEYPDEGGMPLRRAVTQVRMLPEAQAWAHEMEARGVKPQFLLRLDAPVRKDGRCYWPVEVRAEGRLWRSYLVSPDGKKVLPRE